MTRYFYPTHVPDAPLVPPDPSDTYTRDDLRDAVLEAVDRIERCWDDDDPPDRTLALIEVELDDIRAEWRW